MPCEKCGAGLIQNLCPPCIWKESGDEFLIVAAHHKSDPDRIWTRMTLEVAKNIADMAIERLNYGNVCVYNIYRGHPSAALYIATLDGSKDML